MRGGAIILLQPHHMRAREILFETQDVAHFGPAPAIDRLVVIAHAADIAMPARQQPQPHVLGHIGILIFVDKDIGEPAAVLLQNIRVGLEDGDHVQDQVTKIDRVQFDQAALVLVIQLRTAMVIGAGIGGRHFFGRQSAVFPAVDQPGQHARGPAFFVNIVGDDQLFQQADLVVCIKDREI